MGPKKARTRPANCQGSLGSSIKSPSAYCLLMAPGQRGGGQPYARNQSVGFRINSMLCQISFAPCSFSSIPKYSGTSKRRPPPKKKEQKAINFAVLQIAYVTDYKTSRGITAPTPGDPTGTRKNTLGNSDPHDFIPTVPAYGQTSPALKAIGSPFEYSVWYGVTDCSVFKNILSVVEESQLRKVSFQDLRGDSPKPHDPELACRRPGNRRHCATCLPAPPGP